MTYTVRLSRSASAYLHRLDPPTQQRIALRVDQIAEDPYGPHTKLLRSTGGARAARVGRYRILFDVDTAAQILYVTDIGPRGQVYRR